MATFTADEWRQPRLDFILVPIGIGQRRIVKPDLLTDPTITTRGAGSLGVGSWASLLDGYYVQTSDVLHCYKWNSTLLTLTIRKITGTGYTSGADKITVINNPPIPKISTPPTGINWAPSVLTDAAYSLDNLATVIDNVFYYASTDGNIYGYDLATGLQVLNYYVARWRTFFPAASFLAYSSSRDMCVLKMLNINDEPYMLYQLGALNNNGKYTCKTFLQNMITKNVAMDIEVANLPGGILSYADYGSLLQSGGQLTYDDKNYHCSLVVGNNSLVFPRWGVVNGKLYNPNQYAFYILSKYRIGGNGENYDPQILGWPNQILNGTIRGINNRLQAKNIYTSEWIDALIYRTNLDIHMGLKYSTVDYDPISFRAFPTGAILSSTPPHFVLYRNVFALQLNYETAIFAPDYSSYEINESSILLIPSESIPQQTQPTGNYMRYA